MAYDLFAGYGSDLADIADPAEEEDDTGDYIDKDGLLNSWDARMDKSSPTEINWDEVSAKQAEVYETDLPKTKADLWAERKPVKAKDEFRVKIAPDPFSRGGVRAAFYAQVQTGGEEMPWVTHIAKLFLEEKYQKKKDEYLDQLETNGVLVFLTQEWMKWSGKRGKKQRISAIESRALKVHDGGTGIWYHLEEVIDGHFDKWTDNSGKTFSPRENRTILEFAKWTYIWTDGFLIATDLQGTHNEDEYFLTDPAIVCPSQLGRFGPTNFAEKQLEMCVEGADHGLKASFDESKMESTLSERKRPMKYKATAVEDGRVGDYLFKAAHERRERRLLKEEEARKERQKEANKLQKRFSHEMPTVGLIFTGAMALGGFEFLANLCSITFPVFNTLLCIKYPSVERGAQWLTVWIYLKPMLLLESGLSFDGILGFRRLLSMARFGIISSIAFDREHERIKLYRQFVNDIAISLFNRMSELEEAFRAFFTELRDEIYKDYPLLLHVPHIPILRTLKRDFKYACFPIGAVITYRVWGLRGCLHGIKVLMYAVPSYCTLYTINIDPKIETYTLWMKYWIYYGTSYALFNLPAWQLGYCFVSSALLTQHKRVRELYPPMLKEKLDELAMPEEDFTDNILFIAQGTVALLAAGFLVHLYIYPRSRFELFYGGYMGRIPSGWASNFPLQVSKAVPEVGKKITPTTAKPVATSRQLTGSLVEGGRHLIGGVWKGVLSFCNKSMRVFKRHLLLLLPLKKKGLLIPLKNPLVLWMESPLPCGLLCLSPTRRM